MLEAISLPVLLSRPRYPGGIPLDKRLWWKRRDLVALATMCELKAPLEKSAVSLGRTPTSIAHHAVTTGLKLPREWLDAILRKYLAKAKSAPRENLQYPYIKRVMGHHEQVLAINALVPRALPSELRADVCQELLLALFEGRFTVEELQHHPKIIREFTAKMRRANYEGSGYALSLDTPMRDGRSWYDVLPGPIMDDDPEF